MAPLKPVSLTPGLIKNCHEVKKISHIKVKYIYYIYQNLNYQLIDKNRNSLLRARMSQ